MEPQLRAAAPGCSVSLAGMPEDEDELVDVARRLRAGRHLLAMTVYTIQHGRRTPEQVRAVLDRASRAIHRNRLVRRRWHPRLAVH